ncbi:MAG: DUF2249 domain-containing protein [Gammaproteobacteria bacterium]|nr:DUF2249 domain-containing protein [Gammaproteobacteria bacterium]
MAPAAARQRVLDVSALPPPEPLVRVLAELETLRPGEYLCMRHRREPCLLYPRLLALGFDYRTRPGAHTAYEILIWRRGEEAP